MPHVLNGQECNILWLGKEDILSAFVDSYSRGLPPTFTNVVDPTNIYSIIMSCNGSSTNVQNFHCMLLSFAMLLLVVEAMLCSSCYPSWCIHNVLL